MKELRLVPHGNCYWIEVRYDEMHAKQSDHKLVLLDKSIGIDLGTNNLLTIALNKPDFVPVLVNEKFIKDVKPTPVVDVVSQLAEPEDKGDSMGLFSLVALGFLLL